jgi:hypothetical protein
MKYLRKEDVVARSVAGAHLLVPVHGCTRSVYTLNAAGCRLWELIALPRTADELAGALVEEYRIPREAARDDVRTFLADMVRMGLAVERE